VLNLKRVFIERQKDILRICITENEKLSECYIEEEQLTAYPGQIYKGIVKNIVPGIKCAFVDIGTGKNAYMYMDSRLKNLHVKKGQELLVEIIKEGMGSKGPKVNNNITIPGRYSVIETLNNDINISKKITESASIEKFIIGIKKPSDVGIMIRTNAEKVPISEINEEIKRLYDIYRDILKKSTFTNRPQLIFNPGGVLGKILRDNINDNTELVVVNKKEDLSFITDYFSDKQDIKTKVEFYDGNIPIMQFYGIEREILALRKKNVALPCGGSIVIDKTEAMYVIDVNSGKNIKGISIEKTAEITNVEAAKEIARQVKLRNLSGIIVIDFIDIEDKKAKAKIVHTLENGFKDDKNKTIIYPFTELNLIQIARRRRGKSILESIEENCEHCNGKGKILKFSYLKHLIRNSVIRINTENNIYKIYIEICENYREEVLKNIGEFVDDINGRQSDIYIKYVKNVNAVKVEPILFQSQIDELKNYKL
jgi:ribonuclease G